MCSLKNIEKKQNIKFPIEYKRLYQSDFKEIDNKFEIRVGNDVFYISEFLKAAEINDILEEFYDFFGYDIIPIAKTNYDDYICLDYRKNIEKPSIIYWNYEIALENPEEGTLFLYNNIHEFANKLKEI